MVGKELLVVYQARILVKLFADFAMFVEKLVEAGQFAASGVAVAEVVVASTSIDIATVVTIYIAIVVAIVEAITVFVTGHVAVRVAIVVGATLRLLPIIGAIFLAHEGVRVLA